jgi:hypothetical protein
MAADIKTKLTSYLAQIKIVGESANVALKELGHPTTQVGTVTVVGGANTATGVGASFTTTLAAGNWVKVGNDIKRVSAVANNTRFSILGTWSANSAGVPWIKTETVDSAAIAAMVWSGDWTIERNSQVVWKTTNAGDIDFAGRRMLLDHNATYDLVITQGTTNGALLLLMEKRLG